MPDPSARTHEPAASGAVTRRAHAKVNLALSVGPPDPLSVPPGMHPIASWMVPIELHDTMTVRRLPEGSPSRYLLRWAEDAPRPSPIDWPLESDLSVRAHRLLEARAGRPLPIDLTLSKRTPVGGGLGGGSSDGAAMLGAVNDVFSLGFPAAELSGLGRALGSDVPFFISDAGAEPPGAAIVTGFGERIERTGPRAGCETLLLIFPPFGCPTGAVYRAYDAAPRPLRESAVRSLAAGPMARAPLFNDLADPAAAAEPRLGLLLADLRRALPELAIHVTGSGSTLFALLPSEADGDRTRGRVLAARPELCAMVTRTLPA